jgi:hypothetical protein
VVDGIAIQTTRVDGLIENSSGNRFTTKALEQAPLVDLSGVSAQVWTYSGRLLDGTQATNLAAIPGIPTNPLLTNDTRLNTLDADISSRLATVDYVAPANSSIAAIKQVTDSFSNLNSDTATIKSNISLLLDKNMLTIGKSVVHSPTQIVIGANEAVINLVVDENNDTVTGTRAS